MGRGPKFRPSYSDDAHYLHRLAIAVDHDARQPVEWRRRVAALIQELAGELSVARGNPGGSSNKKEG